MELPPGPVSPYYTSHTYSIEEEDAMERNLEEDMIIANMGLGYGYSESMSTTVNHSSTSLGGGGSGNPGERGKGRGGKGGKGAGHVDNAAHLTSVVVWGFCGSWHAKTTTQSRQESCEWGEVDWAVSMEGFEIARFSVMAESFTLASVAIR